MQGACIAPVFAPDSSKMAVGNFSLFIFLSRICPNCSCTQLFLVPYHLFVFCFPGGEVCPGANTAAHQQRIPVCPTLLAPPYLFLPTGPAPSSPPSLTPLVWFTWWKIVTVSFVYPSSSNLMLHT